MPVLRPERREPAVDRIAARVLYQAVGKGVRADAEPVVVAVVGTHLVVEVEGRGAAARCERRRTRVRADAKLERRARPDVDDIVELDGCFDGVAAAVGAVVSGIGREAHAGHGGQHRVHLAARVRRDGRETAPCGEADRVGDGAAGQRVGADANAVVVEVAGFDDVAEHQRRRAATRGERGRAGCATNRQSQGRLSDDVHFPAEPDVDLDVLA